MNVVRQVLEDASGIASICGRGTAARWLGGVLLKSPAILRRRNLQPVDRLFKPVPRALRHRRADGSVVQVRATGPQLLTGVREMWVRGDYLADGWLTLPEGEAVVDLGANRGLFTLMALAHHPANRAVCVEAAQPLLSVLGENLRLNGFEDRAAVVDRFIGSATRYQDDMRRRDDYAVAQTIAQEQLVADHDLGAIGLLKCDIEGSEFGVLRSDAPLVQGARQVTAEIHSFAGDVATILAELEAAGMETRIAAQRGGTWIVQARRV